MTIREASGDLFTIEMASVQMLERSLGMARHTRSGALIGGGVGALFGGAMLFAALADPNEFPVGVGVFAFALSVGVGSGFGALLGYAIETDEWQEVSPKSVRFSAGWIDTKDTILLYAVF